VATEREERQCYDDGLGGDAREVRGPRQQGAEEREQQQQAQIEVLRVPRCGLVVAEEGAEEGVIRQHAQREHAGSLSGT